MYAVKTIKTKQEMLNKNRYLLINCVFLSKSVDKLL